MSDGQKIIMGWDIIQEPAQEPVSLDELAAELPGTVLDVSLAKAMIRAARKRAEIETGVAIGEQTIRMTLNRFPVKSDEDGLVFVLLSWPVVKVTRFDWLDQRGIQHAIAEGGYRLDRSVRPARVEPLAKDEYWPIAQNAVNAVTLEYRTGALASEAVKRAILLTAAHLIRNKDEVAVGNGQLFPIPLAASAILQSE